MSPETILIGLARFIRLIALVYVVFSIFLYFFADYLIFQPHPSSYRDDKDVLKLKTADGKWISAVYLENPQAKYTLLFSHGNAEDIGDNFPFFKELRHIGFAVFAYDYHGYGTSAGKPSETKCYLD